MSATRDQGPTPEAQPEIASVHAETPFGTAACSYPLSRARYGFLMSAATTAAAKASRSRVKTDFTRASS